MAGDRPSHHPSPFIALFHSEKARFDRVSFMSTTTEDISLPFSPFHAVIHDGIDRLMDLMKHDSFTFELRRAFGTEDGKTQQNCVEETEVIPPTSPRLFSRAIRSTLSASRWRCRSTDRAEFKRPGVYIEPGGRSWKALMRRRGRAQRCLAVVSNESEHPYSKPTVRQERPQLAFTRRVANRRTAASSGI
jgi:hypothetical protein